MADDILDTQGLLCPLPVLKAAKRLRAMSAGEKLKVTADDPAAVVDMPHFCSEKGYRLISSETAGRVQTYVIEKT